MDVTITLTTAGSSTSATFDVHWATNGAGPWPFIATVPKATLLAGYTFTPDPTAMCYQVRDTGSCTTVLTLCCATTTTTTAVPTTTTTTTDPDATTTTTTTDPSATTTTTTTIAEGCAAREPDHIWAPNTGGTYYISLIFCDPSTVLYSVDQDTWFTSSINPAINVYSPTQYYMTMTVVVDVNAGAERINDIYIYDGDLVFWGSVYMRQDAV